MRISTALCGALLCMLASAPAQAGLWSSSNAVAAPGGSATMLVSFTGDGRTTDAQVDIAIPTGFTATALALNGGVCAVFAATSIRPATVRVITPVGGSAFPQVQTNLCRVTLGVNGFADTGRLMMFHDGCVGLPTVPSSTRCELDPGFFTVKN